MESYDYIKIRGLDSERLDDIDPGAYECFQGIGGTAGSQSSTPVYISISKTPEAIAEGSWSAQDAIIASQSEYLSSVASTFSAKQARLPKQEGIVDFILEQFGEHVLETLVGTLVSYLWNPIAGNIAEFIVSVAGEAVEFLKVFYNEGRDLCNAMVDENNSMLSWENSSENYDRRAHILTMHNEQIQSLLMQANLSEETVARPGEEINGSWKDWMGDMDDVLGEMQTWIDDTSEGFRAFLGDENEEEPTEAYELPVPIDPGLPEKPPSKHPLVIFIYYLLKYGHLIIKIIELINRIRKRNEKTDM
jgi:hypothetical protein